MGGRLLLAGQPAVSTAEPLHSVGVWAGFSYSVKGAWGLEHNDSVAQVRTCLQRAGRVSFPQGAREVRSVLVGWFLSVDRMAALWRKISYPWEARQCFVQNRVSLGKNEFQRDCRMFVPSVWPQELVMWSQFSCTKENETVISVFKGAQASNSLKV